MWREVEKFQAQDEQGTVYPMVLWEWTGEPGAEPGPRQVKAYLADAGWVDVPEVSPGLYLIGVGSYARRA